MDVKTRAELVRELRFELKTKNFASRYEPRRGETRDQFQQRGGGGDAAEVAQAARWDRAWARRPKRERVRTPRWGGGSDAASTQDWYGYSGWQNHFNYSTPSVRRGRVSRSTRLGKR